MLFAAGHADPNLSAFVNGDRNRVVRFETMRNFAMTKLEAEREIRAALAPVRPPMPVSDDMAQYLLQFPFHVSADIASLYFIGSTSGVLVLTKAFAMVASICGRVGKDPPRPVPSRAMASSLSYVYPDLVASGILCVRDSMQITEMLDGSTDVDRTQLVLSWITEVIDAGPAALPSASAVTARRRIKTEAALLYAFFVVAVLRAAESN